MNDVTNEKDIKKRSIIIIVIVIMLGFAIAGGTYAWLSSAITINNGSYNTAVHCFSIDYNINNVDNSQDITGTLFPSGTITGGLNGRVGLKTGSGCKLYGSGTLKIHINSGTSSTLTTPAASYCESRQTLEPIAGISTQEACTTAGGRWMGYGDNYCENPLTLERMPDYTTQSACTTANGSWITTSLSPLKYAVYNTTDTTQNPISVGHITSSNIGNDITIKDDIVVSEAQKYFYIYIWLDGYMTDNNFTDLPFSGYVKADVAQNNSAVTSAYQRVEYLRSTGTQYIDTGFTPNQDTSVELKMSTTAIAGQDFFGTSNASDGYVYGFYDGTSKVWDNYNDDYGIYTGHFSGNITIYKNKRVTTITGAYNISHTHSTATFTAAHSLYLFARWKSSGAYRPATMNLYSFKIWDNGTIVRDFIPCYNKTTQVRGLYDTVTDEFYINAGGGTFEIGAALQ